MSHGCRRVVSQWIIIDIRENQVGHTRLGITVSKRYGDSHERNRFKRIVREAFRTTYAKLPAGLDLNIKPRSAAKNALSTDIATDLLNVLEHKR